MDGIDSLMRLLTILFVVALVLFIPAIIAYRRRHPNRVAIFALNVFAGWTGIAWIAALVWSLTAIPDDSRSPRY